MLAAPSAALSPFAPSSPMLGEVRTLPHPALCAARQQAFHPRILGPYRLKKRLGTGGMGQVYLAEHILLRRQCAIKLILPEQAGEPLSLSRFEREVRATAALTHWNTIRIYDYGQTEEGVFYYVMEYLAGLSLQDLVEQQDPLAPERVIHFLRQLCGSLREVHGLGLVHCDIKPSNIIACERGALHDVVKLFDFGLVQSLRDSTEIDSLTLQGTIFGSPAFMSPEQAVLRNHVDARSDLYGLGGVGYFLLTGQPPFVCETLRQTLCAHISEPVARLSAVRADVPSDLEEVILRCLEKDANLRFQDADSLDQALAKCCSAGQWTEERAARWWQEQEGKG